MEKLTYSGKAKVLSVLAAIFVTSLFGGLTIYFFVAYGSGKSFVPLISIFPVFILVLVFSIFSLLETFRSYLVYDENGIEYYSGYSAVKKIRPNEIVAMSLLNEFVRVLYKKSGEKKTKSIRVSKHIKNYNAFLEWLSERTSDPIIDKVVDDYNNEVVDFTKNRYGNLSKEEQENIIKRARFIVKILNSVSYLFFIAFFVGLYTKKIGSSFIMRISLLSLVAYGLFLILTLKLSRGTIKFTSKTLSIYPSISHAFLIASLPLCIMAFAIMSQLCAYKNLVLMTIVADVVLYLLYYICSDKEAASSKSIKAKIDSTVVIVVLLTVFAFSFVVNFNFYFDFSEPQKYETVIVGHRKDYSGKHYNHYITVTPWLGDATQKKELSVGESFYSKNDVGDAVLVKMHDGLFKIPFYTVSSISKE